MHYIDGNWVTDDELKLSVFDLSVIRGFGVFDFLRTYQHTPFKLSEHVDRLFNSAAYLSLPVPETKERIMSIVEEGIKKGTYADYNIRIVVTGGISADGTTPGNPSLIMVFAEAHDYPADYYTSGVGVSTYPHVRTFPEAKTLNYLAGIVALQNAKKEHNPEAVYVDGAGTVYEGTTSNIFMVKNNRLMTPKNGILRGITRGVVIDLAKKLPIDVEEKQLSKQELLDADEIFLTASNKEVMPVVRIDGKKAGSGIVGSITKQLIESYRSLARAV